MYEDGDWGNLSSGEMRVDGIVSAGIYRVLVCPVRMLRIRIIGDCKSMEQLADLALTGKCLLN